MAITQRRLTLEEFLKLPERKPALEFEDGVVTQKVSPTGPHSGAQMVLIERINAFGRPNRLALAYPEIRTAFAGSSRVPDIGVYRWDRIPRGRAGLPADVFRAPPDIAIEILSPGKSVAASLRRCVRFVAEGVRIAVLVNPRDESVTLVRPDAQPVVLRGADPIDLDEVLLGSELTAQELFDLVRLD